jgi:hypothetical protein
MQTGSFVAANVNLHGDKPVAARSMQIGSFVAANVNLHGTSPWHPEACRQEAL